MDKENVIKSVIQLIQTKESNNNHSFLFDNDISLSLTQLHILDIISSEENVNNQCLKEKLKISAPAVTKATKKLNQIGCIFEDKSQDNKKIYYRLTNKGNKYTKIHQNRHNKILKDYFSILNKYNDEQLKVIDSFIHDLITKLEE